MGMAFVKRRLVHRFSGDFQSLRFREFILMLSLFWLISTDFVKDASLRARYGNGRFQMLRFMGGRLLQYGQNLPFRHQQLYVSQLTTQFYTDSSNIGWGTWPRWAILLFLANALKRCGMLDVAEIAYQRVAASNFNKDAALAGLGDLYLLEAQWTEEAQIHSAAGALHDESLTPCLRNRSKAWRSRSYSDAAHVLRIAVEENSDNKMAWWLLACCLLKMKQWDECLAVLDHYKTFAPAFYEQNMADAIAKYGRNSAEGIKAFQKNLGRWFGWYRVSELKVVNAFTGRNDEHVREQIALTEREHLIRGTVITGGEVSKYERLHTFPPVVTYEVKEGEILPSYGMVISRDREIFAGSAHIFPVHWQKFSPSIHVNTADAVVSVRASPIYIDVDRPIFFGCNGNYFHFLCEDIPRLILLEEFFPETDRPVLVSHQIRPWQQDILVKLGINPSRWKAIDFANPARVKDVCFASMLSRDLVVHPAAVELVQKRLFGKSVTGEPTKGKRLYLNRGGEKSRETHFRNERQIKALLSKVGFVEVDTGRRTVEEQMDLFKDAEVVAGPGGATFTNLLFAPRGCKALMFGSSADAGDTFGSLASALGQEYFVCLGDGYASTYPYWINTSFDFTIDPADLVLALDRMGIAT